MYFFNVFHAVQIFVPSADLGLVAFLRSTAQVRQQSNFYIQKLNRLMSLAICK